MTPVEIALSVLWTVVGAAGLVRAVIDLRRAGRRLRNPWITVEGRILARKDRRVAQLLIFAAVLVILTGAGSFLVPLSAPEPVRLVFRLLTLVTILTLEGVVFGVQEINARNRARLSTLIRPMAGGRRPYDPPADN